MPLNVVEQTDFTGVLKTFNRVAGTGTLDCSETFELFQRDVLMHRSAAEGGDPTLGDQLNFRIEVRQGCPHACEITRETPAMPAQAAGAAPVALRAWESSRGRPPSTPSSGGGGGYGCASPSERRSGMAALIAHDHSEDGPVASPQRCISPYRRRTDGLLHHGGGYQNDAASRGWMPSFEAENRSGHEAVRMRRENPREFPVPVLRTGTFVGWSGNK